MMHIPELFIRRYGALLGDDIKDFVECLHTPQRESLRINTLKVSKNVIKEELKKDGVKLEPIPWVPNGFFFDNGEMGSSIWHFLGYIYLQGACSMIPPLVLDPKEGELVLDMAASPGSKATQMAQLMNNKGAIIANDVILSRLKPLSFNIDRLGVINTGVSCIDGKRFGRLLPEFFDKVLLDAPCTSDGIVRRDPDALKLWNVERVRRASRIQKSLIVSAFKSLKAGGTLVYSTCTLSPEENEEVVDSLLRTYENAKVMKIDIPNIKTRAGIEEWEGKRFNEEVKNCIRIYPHDNDTEGFFIAKIKKLGKKATSEAMSESEVVHKYYKEEFNFGYFNDVGFYRKGEKIWVGSTTLLSIDLPILMRKGLLFARKIKNGYKFTSNGIQLFGKSIDGNTINLSREEAERYIRGEDIFVQHSTQREAPLEKGQVIVRWASFPLGVGLYKDGRLKNQIPRARRIISIK